jgi:hypothetical protein
MNEPNFVFFISFEQIYLDENELLTLQIFTQL